MLFGVKKSFTHSPALNNDHSLTINLFRSFTNENLNKTFRRMDIRFPYGLAVRIPGFHPGGPGSTPGMGTVSIFFLAFCHS